MIRSNFIEQHEKILVLDFGSPYAQLIGRRVRDLHVYCEVLPYRTTFEKIEDKAFKAIIFVGEPNDKLDPRIEALGIPLLRSISPYEDGISELKDFLFKTAGLKGDWQMKEFVEQTISDLEVQLKDKKVLCAFSGGVDSAVAALLVHRAIGRNLHCIFVDHGLLRKDEAMQVQEVFGNTYNMNLTTVDASDRFLGKLAGITDPEQKRKIIGEEFIRVFEEEAKKIGTVDVLVQGTIYPDIIESGTDEQGVIKSHHNVGGLPDKVDFKELVEPLRDLFKDEVRAAGEVLGLPEEIVWRQPFPGPGLAVRIIGDITSAKVKTLQDADAIYREEIYKAGLHREISQYFAVLTNMRSVGVKGDTRTYDYTVALRGVKTSDFMTAAWSHIPFDVLEIISSRICAEVDNVNRVVYDITSKPPSTIEWE